MKYSDEAIFCVKYLKNQGLLNEDTLMDILEQAENTNKQFRLVVVDRTFFRELAEKLRELWPSGNKSDKYPWRDSVDNLVKRLDTLWTIRNLGEYDMDTCLAVARRYLARFTNDVKYMQTLKYFILKQDRVIQSDGRIRYVSKSMFADMLENVTEEDKMTAELEQVLENATYGEGRLI